MDANKNNNDDLGVTETNPYFNEPDITCRYVDCSDFIKSYKDIKGISFFHLNISSLSKHIECLSTLFEKLIPFEIIAITETRISNESIPHNLEIPNYSCVLTKTEAAAGGTAIYIRNSLTFKVRNDLNMIKSRFLESSFVEIIQPKKENIVIGCIYKHPTLCKTEFVNNYLSPKLHLISKENKTSIILGDFNINLKANDANVNKLLDVLSSNSFFPTINLPTRVTNHSETLIDNIFTNTQRYSIQSGNILSGISDHLPQFAIFETLNKTNKRTEKQYRDWRLLNEQALIDDFKRTNWKDVLKLECLDADISFDGFFNTLEALIDKHVPTKILSKKKSSNKPWITSGIRKSISRRDRILKQFIKEKDYTKKTVLFNNYKGIRNQTVCLIRVSKRLYFRQFFEVNISNPKNLWKGINDLVSTKPPKSSANISLKLDNKIESDPHKLADEFNKYFTNIAQKIKQDIPPTRKNFHDYMSRSVQNSFFFTPIKPEEIVAIIKKLDPHKSTGPFSIPNKVLHLLLNEISSILTDIFNLSFTTGKFISKLKTAKVIPIYKKKGSEQEVPNFRPIALLSNLDKIFEKLAHKRFTEFLDKNKTIFDRQFGFRKNHSTNDNLFCLTEAIREKVDKGEFSCGVFLDLQKAFDSVDHNILLTKLEHYGFRGITSKWVRSYLFDRKQYVSVENVASKPMSINCGVPQGSVLGPLFFLLYINDLQKCLKYGRSFIFADDTALLVSHTTLKALRKRLNIDLKLLHHWLCSNKIGLNVSKTETILFRHPKKKMNYDLKLKLHGKRLCLSQKTKYLGINIDQHLSWETQLDAVAKKLRKANGIISKLRHFLPLKTMVQVYHALFQSHVNYGLQIWAQNLPQNNRIHSLQKSAIRLMTFSQPQTPSLPLFRQLNLFKINELLYLSNIKIAFRALNETPVAVSSVLRLKYVSNEIVTRGNTNKMLERYEIRTSKYGRFSIRYQSIVHWNRLQHYCSTTNLSLLSYSKINKKVSEFLLLQD